MQKAVQGQQQANFGSKLSQSVLDACLRAKDAENGTPSSSVNLLVHMYALWGQYCFSILVLIIIVYTKLPVKLSIVCSRKCSVSDCALRGVVFGLGHYECLS